MNIKFTIFIWRPAPIKWLFICGAVKFANFYLAHSADKMAIYLGS
jgi:hypothetical protein